MRARGRPAGSLGSGCLACMSGTWGAGLLYMLAGASTAGGRVFGTGKAHSGGRRRRPAGDPARPAAMPRKRESGMGSGSGWASRIMYRSSGSDASGAPPEMASAINTLLPDAGLMLREGSDDSEEANDGGTGALRRLGGHCEGLRPALL